MPHYTAKNMPIHTSQNYYTKRKMTKLTNYDTRTNKNNTIEGKYDHDINSSKISMAYGYISARPGCP